MAILINFCSATIKKVLTSQVLSAVTFDKVDKTKTMKFF